MNDIKRIIQGIECCLAVDEGKDCTVCPYIDKDLCTLTWMAEALEVLKEIEKSPVAGTKARIGE